MKLIKPLVFWDCESTGLNVATDRIVSIAIVKYFPQVEGQPPIPPQEAYTLVNPEMNIPAEATEIHGISNEMVKDAPTFFQISQSVLDLMAGADMSGYNLLYFDIPLLCEEFLRVGKELPMEGVNVIDACTIFKKQEPRTLTAAMQFYCGEELVDGHNSMVDTKATAKVLRAQIGRYEELKGKSVEEVAAYCKDGVAATVDLSGKLILDGDGDCSYNFGKAKGKKVKDDPGFGKWMLGQDFITRETKNKLTKVFNDLGITIK